MYRTLVVKRGRVIPRQRLQLLAQTFLTGLAPHARSSWLVRYYTISTVMMLGLQSRIEMLVGLRQRISSRGSHFSNDMLSSLWRELRKLFYPLTVGCLGLKRCELRWSWFSTCTEASSVRSGWATAARFDCRRSPAEELPKYICVFYFFQYRSSCTLAVRICFFF